ncbi:MAG: hypothetical protein LBI60_03785, partial [Bacteroidales bacterium]|nr:hypothetical protein [Bacteroidales bacterium]
VTVSAQGLYKQESSDDDSTDKGSSKNEGSLRDGPQDSKPEAPGEDPIGEGILILSALAGGYALVKKKKGVQKK